MFISLNSLRNYDSREGLELLAKDQDDLLQAFQRCYTDLFKALSAPMAPLKTLKASEIQIISLVRGLLKFSGGMVDCRQHRLD